MRQAMLAAASHELKSPVAAITASVTDVLGRDRFDEAVAREVLEDVRASTGRLEQLITNLLDMSRIESGHARRPTARSSSSTRWPAPRSTACASAGRASYIDLEVPPDASAGARRRRVPRSDRHESRRERRPGGAKRRQPADRGSRRARRRRGRGRRRRSRTGARVRRPAEPVHAVLPAARGLAAALGRSRVSRSAWGS